MQNTYRALRVIVRALPEVTLRQQSPASDGYDHARAENLAHARAQQNFMIEHDRAHH